MQYNKEPIMASATGNKEQETVKLISQKHAMVRANADKALMELAKIEEIFIFEESRTAEKAAELCIAEQNLRSLNERFYYTKKEYDENEGEKTNLVEEWVALELKLLKMQERIESTNILQKNMAKAHENHQENVNNIADELSPEYQILYEDVGNLENLKARLRDGDPELKSVANGTALHIIQCKIDAIHDAIAQVEMKADGLYVEIDEKNDSIDKVQIQIQIEEKQHQARLRQLQKQLQDLEMAQNHMQSGSEYFEKQIDHKFQ